MPVAWLFNLDAEDELALGKSWRRNPELWSRLAEVRRDLAERFCAPEDVAFEQGLSLQGHVGRAWCPTPSALEQLRSAGADLEPAPNLDVLREVNRKGFLLERLPDLCAAKAVWARSEDEALEARARLDGPLRVKREFGVAGRGQRTVDSRGWEDPGELGWLRRSLKRGGVLIEPEVTPHSEWVVHGWIDSTVQVGPVRPQVTSAQGAWKTTGEPGAGPEVGTSSGESLAESAARVGESLRAAGYFGPFGIDAIRSESGLYISDVNARYTMGWVHPSR